MEIKIIETGKIEQLGIVDPKSGCNWIKDLMGNHGALPDLEEDADGYETGYYLMSQDDFNWWRDLTDAYQAADDRYHNLLHNTLDNEAAADLVQDAGEFYGDLEDYPGHLNACCDHAEGIE